jgi:hypothetical protein
MAKNLLHCETGFGVYRSTQLGHIPFFLLLYLLVGPSIMDLCTSIIAFAVELLIGFVATSSEATLSIVVHIENFCFFCSISAFVFVVSFFLILGAVFEISSVNSALMFLIFL